jgi:hypothetical protein
MPESNEPRRFFVVWSPQGGPPIVRFPSFAAARSVAIRMTQKFPEQDFFVLASCWGKLAKPPVEVATTGVEVATTGVEVASTGSDVLSLDSETPS